MEKKINSHHTGVSTFASRTSPSTDQSLQKSFHLSDPRKIELKKISSPSENKKYPNAQAVTNRHKSNLTMKRKLNVDNGLQGQKTERQLVTGGIFYCRDSAGFSVSASNKRSCNLKDLCFEIGNKNIPPNRWAQ
jgi:hypothetical protein